MGMLEALSRTVRPPNRLWARPESWAGSGRAICYDGERWLLVPTARGGQQAMLPSAADTFGLWEVVSPDLVNEELP